jgi:hypothetical protein
MENVKQNSTSYDTEPRLPSVWSFPSTAEATDSPERILWRALRDLFPGLFVLTFIQSLVSLLDVWGVWLLFAATYLGVLLLAYQMLVRVSCAPLRSFRIFRVRHPVASTALKIQYVIGDWLRPFRQHLSGWPLRMWCMRHPVAVIALLMHFVLGVLLSPCWQHTYLGLDLWCVTPGLVVFFRLRAQQPALRKLILLVLLPAGILCCISAAIIQSTPYMQSLFGNSMDTLSNPLVWMTTAMQDTAIEFRLYQFFMHLLTAHCILLLSYFSWGGTQFMMNVASRVPGHPWGKLRVVDRITLRIDKTSLCTAVIVAALLCNIIIYGLATATSDQLRSGITHTTMTPYYWCFISTQSILLLILFKYLIAPTAPYASAISLTLGAIVLNIGMILSMAFTFPDGLDTTRIGTMTPYYLLLLSTLGILISLLVKNRCLGACILPTQRVRYIRNFVVVGFLASIVYHAIQTFIFQCGYPQSTFLFRPYDRFMDFFNVVRDCATLNPFAKQGGYFPFAYVLGFVLSLVQPVTSEFTLLMLVFTGLLVYFGIKHLRASGLGFTAALCAVLPITLFSYPYLYALDRGNFDFMICLSFVLYYLAIERGAEKQAIVFLALGIAAKAYTLVYVVQLLQEKRWRAVCLLAVICAAVTLLSLSVFPGGLLPSTRQYLQATQGALQRNGIFDCSFCLRFTTSLYAWLVGVAAPWFQHLQTSMSFLQYYNMACLVASIALMIYIIKYEQTRWRMVTLLTLSILLLPFAAGDYRSVFLLIPLWLYVAHAAPSRYDRWYVLLFGLFFIPKDYGILQVESSVAILINPAVLMLLAGVLIKHNLEERAATRMLRPNTVVLQENGKLMTNPSSTDLPTSDRSAIG